MSINHDGSPVSSSPSSSYLLPGLLLVSKGVIEVFAHDGQVTRHHRARTALDEVERFLLTWGVQVIEEDPSNASSLSSVPDVEVSVAPKHVDQSMSNQRPFILNQGPTLKYSVDLSCANKSFKKAKGMFSH